MDERTTPCSYVYSELKDFGGISNKDAVETLILDNCIPDKTRVSREIVNIYPAAAQSNRGFYRSFDKSVPSLVSRIVERQGGGAAGASKTIGRFSSEAALSMVALLDKYQLSGTLYKNVLDAIMGAEKISPIDRATLLVMLFVATGCTCVPEEAAGIVEAFATRIGANILGTLETTSRRTVAASQLAEDAASYRLALIRVYNGEAFGKAYPLSEAGTVVGRLSGGPSSITDVGPNVSRHHLRIWKQDGTWLCQGFEGGSTNGTVLQSSVDGSETVVEPPRRGREKGRVYGPVRIAEGDILVLGGDTTFIVRRTALG